MKGRSTKKLSPTDEQENANDIQVNVNPVQEENPQKEEEPSQSPTDEQENADGGLNGIDKSIVLKAIELNPQYEKFYLNKKGFVFTLGTSKKQLGDAVLINVKNFK